MFVLSSKLTPWKVIFYHPTPYPLEFPGPLTAHPLGISNSLRGEVWIFSETTHYHQITIITIIIIVIIITIIIITIIIIIIIIISITIIITVRTLFIVFLRFLALRWQWTEWLAFGLVVNFHLKFMQ